MNKLTAIGFVLALGCFGNDRIDASDKSAANPATREQKLGSGETTTRWGYYGVTPESPNRKRLCYGRYPEAVDLSRDEKYAIHPAQLWVCDIDGGNHRKLFDGSASAHNGLVQSWLDDQRIVFQSADTTWVINADTGEMALGPYKGYSPGHYGVNGKVLLGLRGNDQKKQGLYELDTASGKMALVVPYNGGLSHVQYSPDGKTVLFKTSVDDVPSLGVADLATGRTKVFSGVKPMHFQWFDNDSFFGYIEKGSIGIDSAKHIVHEMYRWNLEGEIIEYLSGHGCHGATRPDGRYFAGESWYFSDQISLNVYQRGESSPLMEIFSHSFSHLTWRNGGRHHVNPSFSRDGMRLYYNKAVNENTSQAFAYDLTGLVEGLQ